jgi:hypothetical protein
MTRSVGNTQGGTVGRVAGGGALKVSFASGIEISRSDQLREEALIQLGSSADLTAGHQAGGHPPTVIVFGRIEAGGDAAHIERNRRG